MKGVPRNPVQVTRDLSVGQVPVKLAPNIDYRVPGVIHIGNREVSTAETGVLEDLGGGSMFSHICKPFTQ